MKPCSNTVRHAWHTSDTCILLMWNWAKLFFKLSRRLECCFIGCMALCLWRSPVHNIWPHELSSFPHAWVGCIMAWRSTPLDCPLAATPHHMSTHCTMYTVMVNAPKSSNTCVLHIWPRWTESITMSTPCTSTSLETLAETLAETIVKHLLKHLFEHLLRHLNEALLH